MNRTILAIPLAAGALLAGCGGDDASPGSSDASGTTVNVETFIFQPDPITVDAGTEVTWANADQTVHTVTAGTREKPTGEYDGKLAEKDGSFSRTYDKPGTYDYFCSIHSGPGMTGQVIVK